MSHIRQTNDQDPHYPSYDTQAIDMAVMLGHRLEIRCGPRALVPRSWQWRNL